MKKKILLLSGKNKHYSRNKLFINILKKNYDIIEKNFDGNIFLKNISLLKILFIKYDLIFIMWPYWSSFFFTKFLNLYKNKPIICDFFTFLNEDYLDNNKKPKKLMAFFYKKIENYILGSSDGIITDTIIHKQKIIKKKLKVSNKILTFEISEKNSKLKEQKKINTKIKIIHSSANRGMHGVRNIIKMINNLPYKLKNQILVRLILSDYGGELKRMIQKYKLDNIIHIKNRLNKNLFLKEVSSSDITLGIFGNSIKSHNVISNFIVTCCNYSKIIITKKTPVSKFYLNNTRGIFLLNSIKGNELAKILYSIKHSTIFRKNNSSRSKDIFIKYFDININSKKLHAFMEKF